jgi:alpha-1,3-rhamnosyl/mannosyltransferase
MAAGCPVICSSAASLPEVAGDAAILVDPKNPAEWQTALHKVLTDEALRGELRKKGLEQAQKFSWRRTAELTLKTFNMLQ